MSNASRMIRDSIAALPDGLRGNQWDSDYGLVLSSRYGTGGEVVADCLPGHLVEPGQQKETARHIALLASPHVAAAVADLLDAVTDALGVDDYTVKGYAEAVEAAITRAGAS